MPNKKKTVKFVKKGNEMDVDEAGIEKSYYDALWEDSPGMEDEMMVGAVEQEKMGCEKCYARSAGFHRR